jgi:kynurenine formamidase
MGILDTQRTISKDRAVVNIQPPRRIDPNGTSTDEFPLERFFGRARLLDVREEPKDEPVSLSVLPNAGIEAGEIVPMLVGYHPPTDPDELPSYAYLSAEAAELLGGSTSEGVCNRRAQR